jgi:hypothetical protein
VSSRQRTRPRERLIMRARHNFVMFQDAISADQETQLWNSNSSTKKLKHLG